MVIPHQKVDHPRVTHPYATVLRDCSPFSFDLHVLGAPPALILSRDQTLICNLFVSPTGSLRDIPRGQNPGRSRSGIPRSLHICEIARCEPSLPPRPCGAGHLTTGTFNLLSKTDSPYA